LAGREANAKVLNAVAPRVAWLVGGSADLAPPNKSRMTFDGAGDFSATDRRDHRHEHLRRVGAAEGAAGQIRLHRREQRGTARTQLGLEHDTDTPGVTLETSETAETPAQ
jgi:hypothetical protein